jgi:hypothetical protein
MTPLITREFAVAFGKNDLNQMAHLFRRYIPVLYSVAAYFACFIAVEAEAVTYILGGDQFREAALAVAIMSFYPIHQTYGQLSGSVFYATGQTALYRNIGIGILILGLPVAYFLLAPADKMGIHAGAVGLAIKMVAIQFIGVNIQLYYNTKLLRLKYWKYAGHQIISVGCLLVLALSSSFLSEQMVLSGNVILKFILAGFVYTGVVLCLACYVPIIFGLRKEDVQSVFLLIRRIRA